MATENSRADALTEAVTRTIETIKRQLDLIADRAPGDFLDKRPVVQSLGSHVRRLEKALAEAESLRPAAAPIDDARERIAKALHYPDCWDTAAYPTLDTAVLESLNSFLCSECVANLPAPSPADERAAQYLCTPKAGGEGYVIERAPDSFELRDCEIIALQADEKSAFALVRKAILAANRGGDIDVCSLIAADHILSVFGARASSATKPADERAATPAAKWRVDGETDPHAGRYDVERAALTLGMLTDDELANGAFMNYDRPMDIARALSRDPDYHSPIVWMTAVKDRIRWLSRALERARAASANDTGVEGATIDVTLPYENALHELIRKILPDLDSGDILADAQTAINAVAGRAMTDAQIDAIWANLDARGSSLYEPHQWEVEMRRRFARTILSRSPTMATEPVRAWETDDGRVISDEQKQQALRDGGASTSSVRPFSIALGRIGAVPAMAAEAQTDWRELSRRLYVELFHCDQQMRSTRDEDGEPHWTQSTVVRDVLADAKAALDAAPQPAQASGIVEAIAAQWDGCTYTSPGEDIDIGAAIRDAWKRLSGTPAQADARDYAMGHRDGWNECLEAQASQADDRVGLTSEQRASITWAIRAAVERGYTADADVLRALLATPQPEPRAEVTDKGITAVDKLLRSNAIFLGRAKLEQIVDAARTGASS